MTTAQNEKVLQHIGVIRRSGRYPYGSGGDPYQTSMEFKSTLDEMRGQGLSDSQIAQSFGIATTDLRDAISKSTEIIYSNNVAMATRLRGNPGDTKQMSVRAIAERMLGDASKESTVRGWLKAAENIKDKTIEAISNILRGHVDVKGFVDVGKGNELYMGVSDVRLRAAVASLLDEGYMLHPMKGPQLGVPGKLTEYKILGPPGSTWGEAQKAFAAGLVYSIQDKSADGGLAFMRPKAEPVSVDSKRIAVRYGPDGGDKMDGVIEVRRGSPELDLGSNRYAQVRVAVDGTHYLKGMAMYADDLPSGTDIRFNTNKTDTGSKLDAMKPLKEGIENAGNRFGAIVHPHIYKDANGNEVTSALNMVNEEGKWNDWSNNLASQVLSKQSISLAKTQLAKASSKKQKDLDEIMALTNPIVKKKLLLDFAQSADSDAVSLKAAAMPRQSTHVILPMNSMRPTEVYAPNFNPGDKVALVRYPHGGPFEIAELTVNNSNTVAKRLMGGATDAIGIHHSVAQKLSGADFDGDTVLVIRNDSGKIKSKPMLEELKNWDPKTSYPAVPGMRYMTKENTQKEMGKISNLITDMTIKGAQTNEIVRAVKHSMVVIDAEKHELNYKQSEQDNNIAALKAEYQSTPGSKGRGASTIISRSKGPARVPQQRLQRQSEGGAIDPKTGELIYVPTGKTRAITRTNPRTGVKTTTVEPVTTRGRQMEFTKDAYTLSSGKPMENVYAEHANTMKALANTARKSAVAIKDPPISPYAKRVYSKEVASLKTKLRNAQMNAPLERRAQTIANATAKARIAAHPDIDDDIATKIRYQALADARAQTGAAKQRIGSKYVPFLQREWDAIQAGAIAPTTLKDILDNSDISTVKTLATPKYRSSLTPGQLALAKTMAGSGRGLAEIAAALGLPASTIADNLANS